MLEKLRYGTSSITLDLNNKFCFYPLSSPAIEQKYEEADIVRLALKETDIPLSRYIKHGDKIALVISDQTRPTGSNIYVPILLEEIMKFGVSKVTVIIALGLHQSPTFKEIRILFGGEVPANLIVVKHDAWKDLKQQGEARFRREAVDADKIILTGAVTFHPMTGYSGGRKSLLPGVAAVDDIYSNHRLYFEGYTKHPGVGPAIIRDNPVCKDIRERTSGFKNLWALNVVLGEDKKIAYASCGNVDKVWTLCCNQVSQRTTVKIDALYDAVIASAGGYPSDFSFYQSMKVLTNSSRACKNNGILIVLSQCPNGWEIRKDLFRYFSMTQEQIAEDLFKEFTIDGLALYMALNIIRKHKVWLYSDLPKNEVELAGMHHITDQRMITDIITESENVALITNGASILPVHVDIEGKNYEK